MLESIAIFHLGTMVAQIKIEVKLEPFVFLMYNGNMAESFKYKRVIFPKKEQGKFVLESKMRLGLTWKQLSHIFKVSEKILIDWKNEKVSMPFGVAKKLSKKAKLRMPKDIEIRDRFWYVKKGAKKGGLAVYKKYGVIGGDQEKRKEKWREWWEKEGKFKKYKILEPLSFEKPRHSKNLAEFAGIVMGDGGISRRQITITLNRIADKEYVTFVVGLIKKLFNVDPGINQNSRYIADNIVISRTGIVDFCVEKLGLKIGNKIRQQIDIPDWIKDNEKYCISCIRGLVDTDGSIIFHKYKSGGKCYCYKKLSYCSRSLPLLKSAGKIFKKINIKHRFTKNNYEIRIEAQKEVAKYFDLIGSHNPKHLKRYKNKV
jgi:hypothetical protein